MRKKILIAGNWKMNALPEVANSLIEAAIAAPDNPSATIVIIPPFIYLSDAVRLAQNSNIKVGAQNCHFEKKGAFTGEISAEMLAAVGCKYVIAGHSERRMLFGETDEIVGKKTAAILEAGITPIVCVGETSAERRDGSAFEVVKRQFDAVANAIGNDGLKKIAIAYEPVWAIGTGLAATARQAQEMHAFIRGLLASYAADNSPLLYGGSVTDSNAKELFEQPDIDGALVGGASLKSDIFEKIINAA